MQGKLRRQHRPKRSAFARAWLLRRRGLSRATGISQPILGKFINMRNLPVVLKRKKDERQWRTEVLRLADFFKCLPEDLFSEFQQENVLEKNRAYAEIHFGEVQALLAAERAQLLEPDAVAEAHDLRVVIERTLSTLPPRQAKILRARFGFDGPEMTLDAIAKHFGVSSAAIWQGEVKALRTLQHPSRANRLLEAAVI